MEAQRQAFLNAVEADLTTSRPSQPDAASGPAAGRRRKGPGARGAVAGAFLASAAFLVLPAHAAQARPTASEPGSVVIQDGNCYTPDFVQEDHTKICPGGLAFMSYVYEGADHVHTNLWCFIFDASSFGCGGWTHIGQKTRCGYV